VSIVLVLRHLGPGPHPSGSPQSVHGQGGQSMTKTIPVQVESSAIASTPLDFKTSSEAAKYLVAHKIAMKAKLTGLKPTEASRIVGVLVGLAEKYDVEPWRELSTSNFEDYNLPETAEQPTADVAQYSAGGNRLRINPKYFNVNDGPDDHYNIRVLGWNGLRQQRAETTAKTLANSQTLHLSDNEIETMKYWGQEEAKYNRYSVAYKGMGTDPVIVHEFGHNVYGLAEVAGGSREQFQGSYAAVCRRMREDGSRYRVSAYGHVLGPLGEAFAEWFTMYECGEKDKLPKYTTDFIDHALWLARH